MATENRSWHQRIGGNRTLVLVVMVSMLCLFTVDMYIMPALGVGGPSAEGYVRFTVNGRTVSHDRGRFETLAADWHRFQLVHGGMERRRRGGGNDFLADLMLAELAKDAGVVVTDGALRKFLEEHPLFTDANGKFDGNLFEKARMDRFGGMKARAFEEEARRHLLVHHYMKIYSNTFLVVNDEEVYRRWKADYPKVSVVYAWSPVSAARDALDEASVREEDVKAFWSAAGVQDRHRLEPRFAFEAAHVAVAKVEDAAWKEAREAWKGEADLALKQTETSDEAYDFYFAHRRHDFALDRQEPPVLEILRKENEAAVAAEDEERRKKLPAPADPAATPEIDFTKMEPALLPDREAYRRYWRHRIEKELGLRNLLRKVLAEAKEGKKTLAEAAAKWSRPGVKIEVHLQETPVDQYAVEKIPGLGGPNCGLRYAINGYKPEQAGAYHPDLVNLSSLAERLDERGHLAFRLIAALPREVPPMETVREKLVQEILEERARDRARADLEVLRKAAEEGRTGLEAAAKARGMETAAAGPFNAFSWRPPTPLGTLPADGRGFRTGWKEADRRANAVMTRYAALRDTPEGAVGPVLDDVTGTGAYYVAQVIARADPRFEEMTQAQIAQFRRTLVRERTQAIGTELSFARLRDRLGLLVEGKRPEETPADE
jgi:hypothetical protein